MGRPRSNDLPQYVKQRKSGNRMLYYYQRYGKTVPLGVTYFNAEERALSLLAGAPLQSKVDNLTAEEIIGQAIPARRQPGIYFLILRGQILYIGQSADVWTRITQHLASRTFDSFSWFPCPLTDLDRIEALCIAKFRPAQNAGVRPFFRTRGQNAAANA